jgi:sodium-dependent phosphate cotransporter
MTPNKKTNVEDKREEEDDNNKADSLVFVSLNDAYDGNKNNEDTHINAIDTTDIQDEQETTDNSPPSSPTSAGHRRHSSRIGRIYRSIPEKGIHIAAPASDHDTENEHNPSSVNKTLNDVYEDDQEEMDATWHEVFMACCCHTATGWAYIGIVIVMILCFLYFFMFGLDMLSASFQVVSGCSAGSLLGSDTNPLASVLIGIVATALLQSSSTTTSIVVAMCGSGLDVHAGIYIVMGANIGTSVTSMLVSLTHMGDGEELERAFAGSALYYLFNIMTAVVLLPLEVGTQYLYRLTKAMLPGDMNESGEDTWNSPIKAIVSPLTKRIIIANKALVTEISTGESQSCDEYYPVTCEGGVESYETCKKVGMIGCDSATGKCPAFFQDGATKPDDMVAGTVCLILAVFILCICLIGLVAVLQKVLFSASKRIIYKATKMNGILAILVGTGTYERKS